MSDRDCKGFLVAEALSSIASTVTPIPHRYDIRSRIGSGSSSIVFRAYDNEKEEFVALKQLRYPDAIEKFNLKNEFRSLQDIYHPNIAQLFDFIDGEGHCFIAMQLIKGTDFVSFARRSLDNISGNTIANYTLPIRRALAHLISGLGALHAAGKLHRDIKPTNVIVEPSGRAVLVDFGLCMDLRPSRFQFETQSLLHAGTPAYMAPERLKPGLPVAEASDWYGVGAMLYEALVGEVPYRVQNQNDTNQFYDVREYCEFLREAQKKAPTPPHKLNRKIPKDLSELALSLLQWNPDSRPTDTYMKKFASALLPEEANNNYLNLRYRSEEYFVGRINEQKKLQQAFRCSSRKNVTVLIEGISGVGKTTLVERFLSSVFESDGALVLKSRCHPQEQVKYNAVDGLIDNLSTFLRGRQGFLADIDGENLRALCRVFPILERVIPSQSVELSADSQLVLQQAMQGLRDLLANIVKDRPLVIWIDDAQWCDPTSVAVLRDVFAHSKSPSSLLIISFRSEDRDANAVISRLSGAAKNGMLESFEHVKLLPLSRGEIGALAAKVEGLPADKNQELLKQVLDDTGGLPLFVIEWAHRYRESGKPAIKGKIDVGSLLKERVISLPRKLREIMEIVAVSSRPLEEKVLIEIAASGSSTMSALYRLCNEHLLRKTLQHGRWSFESYHDKIRRAAQELLDAEDLCSRHRQIADVLRAHKTDPEILLEHYLGADDRIEAAHQAREAGNKAVSRLAFDRGAEFFGLAVQLLGRRKEDFELLEAQADALANAGHTKKAARTYYKSAFNAGRMLQGCGRATQIRAKAADQALAGRATQIRAKAAEQALAGGFFLSGRKLLRGVFSDLELSFPTRPLTAHFLSLKNRLSFWWWLKKNAPFLGEPPRNKQVSSGDALQADTHNVTPRELRLDTLWIASRNMTMMDYTVGEAMTSRYLTEVTRDALGQVYGSPICDDGGRSASGAVTRLRSDHSSRLLRALGLEASIYANIGQPWTFQQSRALLNLADKLLQHSPDEYDHAFLDVCRTSIEFFRGNWRSCRDNARSTVARYQEKFTEQSKGKKAENQSAFRSRHWDITVTLGFELSTLAFLGELSDLRQKVPNLLDDAERRGDRYRSTLFASSYTVFLPLADDCPERALENAESLIKNIPRNEFISLHFSHFISTINTYLYQGRAREAWQLIEERWPFFRKAWLHWTGCIGSHLLDLRARTALAAAKEESKKGNSTKSRHLLKVSLRDASAIGKRQLPHAAATEASIRAGVAAVDNDSDGQKEQLVQAVSGFETAEMKMHRAAALMSLGRLIGGHKGDEMLATSMEFFASQKIRRPELMAELLFPGNMQS